jgi:hypothetical protein
MATKDDLKAVRAEMATKGDLKAIENRMATKEDLQLVRSKMATKDDLQTVESRMATKDDLKLMATKQDLKLMATKEDLKLMATKQDMQSLEERIVSGVNEIVQAQTDHMDQRFDGMQKQIHGLQTAMTDTVKTADHEALKKRVTTLEKVSLKGNSV